MLEHSLREGGGLAGGDARTPMNPAPPRHDGRVRLHAVVVMPDHVHLLFSPRRDPEGWPYPLVDILQGMKSAMAHRINRLLHLSGPVWEDSFDHVLRSDESLKENREYIRQNPVRRGLVRLPKDHRWLWVDPAL